MGGSPIRGHAREGMCSADAGRDRVGVKRRKTAIVYSVILLWAVAVSIATRADDASILESYPGRLVSVGAHRLHLYCVGNGGPTVVFESGLGGFSLEWDEVQKRLASGFRVCAYDRAGYGWSELGPLPRTARQSAIELHTLLHAAGESAPYLLVAHSYGGFVASWYARRYRDEVAGLVLLDASSPEQFERLPALALPGVRHDMVAMPRLSIHYPAAQATAALQLMMLPKARLTHASELDNFAAAGRALQRVPTTPLDVPVIVVSRTRRVFGTNAGGAVSEKIWYVMQQHLTALSIRSDHWLATGAGHQIHLDRPDLVALAVSAVRMTPSNAPPKLLTSLLSSSAPQKFHPDYR
ncbi:MAG: alpha/beta hydrolase [Gammaproteobacteria bacterium]|nr:alpha/beta hydrolase [Gammaproteobacteria bacterium]